MVATLGRTRRLTAEWLNTRFQRESEARLAYFAHHSEQIGQRLQELDEEWDVERAIEVEAAGTVLTGTLLGIALSRKWFLLPAFAAAMLLLRNIRGEYPLLSLFRRMGFRTANEIAEERYALKALRGDFEQVDGTDPQPQAALDAAHPTGQLTEAQMDRSV
jgi:hypothetical protein